MKRIVIAGGCFWGVEAYFKQLKGVIDTSVGYTNGDIENPKYEDLVYKRASHAEAVEIIYDETVISLVMVLEHLFRIIDPTSLNKQGGDIGIQYRTGIYYNNLADLEIINDFMVKQNIEYDNKVKVEILEEVGYVNAEEYHQDYLDKNPRGYCHVDMRLAKKEELKQH